MADLDEKYFRSVPWCAKLLEEPGVVIVPTPCRQKKESTENELNAVTLNTEQSIPHWLTFYKRPAPGATRVAESYSLLSLGTGVNSYPHLVAGGIIGVILDENMGNLGLINRGLDFEGAEGFVVTAYLNINYVKAVPTPGNYLATATLREIKGRKRYLEASVRNREGTVLATAEALWIEVSPKL